MSLVLLLKVFQVCFVAVGLINECNHLRFSPAATLIRSTCKSSRRKKAGTPWASLHYVNTNFIIWQAVSDSTYMKTLSYTIQKTTFAVFGRYIEKTNKITLNILSLFVY